jgi:delta8-fatty-acid desaturase
MPLVKEFARENNLPYLVDDYFTGFRLTVKQMENVAKIASECLMGKKTT